MKSISGITGPVAVAFVLVTLATNGFAQVRPSANTPDESDKLEAVRLDVDALSPVAATLIREGDLLIGDQKYARARDKYQAALKMIRAEGDLPAIAMRRIANAYYFEKNYPSVIRTLDDLADEAAQVGDIVTQALAQVDAAWALGEYCFRKGDRHGAMMEIRERMKSLERLLESPYLPEENRAEITARACDGCHAVEDSRREELTCYASN